MAGYNKAFNEGGPTSAAKITEPHRAGYRWVMLSLLWLLYVTFGLISRSIAPLVTPILRDLNLSYTQMGLILGSWQITYIIVALFAGAIIDGWGIRKSLMAGVVTMALSSVLRYFPMGFEGMFGAVALFGAGGCMISIGCPKTISIWFEGRSRGTAVGFYLTGTWIGGILAMVFTNSLVMPLMSYSWRGTFLLYGLLTFVGALLWWILARDAGFSGTQEQGSALNVFVNLIRIPNIWKVVIMGLLTFSIIHGFYNWLPKILEAKGFSPKLAGLAASAPLAAAIPCLLIIPSVVPPERRALFLSLSALFIGGALLLAMTTSGVMQVVGLVVSGAMIVTFIPLQTLILMETPEVGSKYMGSAGGLYFCVSEIGGFAGPFLMGALVDMTGTFLSGGLLLIALSVTISVVGIFLKTPPHLE